MAPIFDTLGLEANWLPALIGLVGLPLLYANLATDVHREYSGIVKDAGESGSQLNRGEMMRLIGHIDNRTQLFQLDWWVVGAFGALLFAIMSCSDVQSLCTTLTAPDSLGGRLSAPAPLCSESFNAKALKGHIAIYGSLFAVLIGFRLIWARVELAREVKSYYACAFRLPCVIDPS
jgi:hypothetical protein